MQVDLKQAEAAFRFLWNLVVFCIGLSLLLLIFGTLIAKFNVPTVIRIPSADPQWLAYAAVAWYLYRKAG